MSEPGLLARKDSHLALCERGDVEHRGSTLLEEVTLLHDPLPELALEEIELGTRLFGRSLAAPLLISGMTGGTAEGAAVNRDLALVAHKCGLGMGLGSQRAMLGREELARTFRVRDVAPDILVLANLGVVQAREAGTARVRELVEAVGADALCLHLNVAQELVQVDGDRDFRGTLDTLARMSGELAVPVVAKETGCGMSPRALERLHAAGIRFVDVSGAGGTTWTGVEALRGPAPQRALGEELREWGVPTAPSIVYARRAGLSVIASGGIRSGLDVARALALGADAAAAALPFLRARAEGGVDGALEVAQRLVATLRAATLLTGTRRAAELCRAPRVLGPRLRAWLE
jgi:isopentenyl-diphosphate delta-isomerase